MDDDTKQLEEMERILSGESVSVESPTEEDMAAAKEPVEGPSAKLLDDARELGLRDEEIQGMTPEELVRQVSLLERAATKTYKATMEDIQSRQPAPAPVQEPVAEEDDLDESEFSPALVKRLRALKQVSDENKQLRERLERVEQATQAQSQQSTQERVLGIVKEYGADKEFDIATNSGKERFMELLTTAQAIFNAQKHMKREISEPELIRKALKALDIDPVQKTPNGKVEENRKKFSAGAIGGVSTRKAETNGTSESAESEVLGVLRKHGRRVPAEAKPVDWLK